MKVQSHICLLGMEEIWFLEQGLHQELTFFGHECDHVMRLHCSESLQCLQTVGHRLTYDHKGTVPLTPCWQWDVT